MLRFGKGVIVMIKKVYNLSIERSTKEDIEVAINEFQSSGWELKGDWNLGDAHTFITFIWSKEGEPIYPAKYPPSK